MSVSANDVEAIQINIYIHISLNQLISRQFDMFIPTDNSCCRASGIYFILGSRIVSVVNVISCTGVQILIQIPETVQEGRCIGIDPDVPLVLDVTFLGAGSTGAVGVTANAVNLYIRLSIIKGSQLAVCIQTDGVASPIAEEILLSACADSICAEGTVLGHSHTDQGILAQLANLEGNAAAQLQVVVTLRCAVNYYRAGNIDGSIDLIFGVSIHDIHIAVDPTTVHTEARIANLDVTTGLIFIISTIFITGFASGNRTAGHIEYAGIGTPDIAVLVCNTADNSTAGHVKHSLVIQHHVTAIVVASSSGNCAAPEGAAVHVKGRPLTKDANIATVSMSFAANDLATIHIKCSRRDLAGTDTD